MNKRKCINLEGLNGKQIVVLPRLARIKHQDLMKTIDEYSSRER